MRIDRYEKVQNQYSKITRHGNTVYLAGLIAEDVRKDISGQSAEIFRQIDQLLEVAGTCKSNLLAVTVYITSMEDYSAFKEAYAAWIDTDNLPSRATVRADLIDPRLKVEIVATAAIRES